MKKLKYIYLFSTLSSLVLSCSSSSSEPTTEPTTPVAITPSSALLIFPDDDTECNEGVIDANNDSRSTVTFEWLSAENTDSYEIKLKNLDTGSITTSTSTTNEKDISINRGTPYEWYVISLANGTSTTATSETWSFYNQGKGIQNYAPFPAIALTPQRGSTITNTETVTLQWSASDVDNDIASYEILFGTNETPENSLGDTTETTIQVTIAAGNIYYWKVITTDSYNNSSNSELFEFRVE
ncbi:hypothetical protein H0I23_11475 [Cellulophaga sp. HaHaR_3_176]|uniref:hypothetical protein n=1 Tax=Cellulophaga sp. HaHaR_3_176 TaxID=1942464 RepID=UPI001C1F2294|nr:hypothetical protein [Cellulophaga sp. HaHaR_3_176]QWX83071.1 hypothetical protein H0I23_11475 [Cellulophaga sp. HaHaR_3_176]